MKKTSVLIIVLCGLFSFVSCKKDKDAANYFSFDGKAYSVDSVAFDELVFNDGDANELSVFQFQFLSMSNGDTTRLYLAVLDRNSNTLGTNYPAIAQNSVTDTRGIFPFGILFVSGISFEHVDGFVTSDKGSVDIKKSGSIYTFSFNDIGAGTYDDLFDSNDDNDLEYTEAGIIQGNYVGPMDKTIHILSKSNVIDNPLIKSLQPGK
jgi:hypothetical protein